MSLDCQVHFKLSRAGSPQNAQQCLIMLKSKTVDLAAYFALKIEDGVHKATITSQEIAKRLGTLVSFTSIHKQWLQLLIRMNLFLVFQLHALNLLTCICLMLRGELMMLSSWLVIQKWLVELNGKSEKQLCFTNHWKMALNLPLHCCL